MVGPVPTTVSILRRNVAHLPQVEVLAVALGASSGRLKFYSSKYSHASSARSVHPNQLALEPETGEVEEIEVPVSTLDQFMAVRQTAGPVLLKLDVQGFESEVIRGGAAALARIDYLLFEASYVPLYEGEPLFEEMHALARAHGFTLVGPVGFLEDPAHRLLQADLLYRRQAIR